eukprot:902070-Rhodomonas_salina.1
MVTQYKPTLSRSEVLPPLSHAALAFAIPECDVQSCCTKAAMKCDVLTSRTVLELQCYSLPQDGTRAAMVLVSSMLVPDLL